MKTKAVIARCFNYELDNVRSATREIVSHLGGVDKIVERGDKVLIKVNNIGAYSPERAATTHPTVVEAVIDLVQEHGGIPTVCDGPLDIHQKNPFLVSGIEGVCDKTNTNLINFHTPETVYEEVPVRNGLKLKTVSLPKEVLEADVIINLPKLKTHNLTVFTGAVKNLFGFPLFPSRKIWHRDFHKEHEFSEVLVDVLRVLRDKVKLSIMDAIVGMEGDGPVAGVPKEIGLLIASQDPVALDAVCTYILGFDPLNLSTTAIAHIENVGVGDMESIDILGESIEQVNITDFALPPVTSKGFMKSTKSKLATLFVTSILEVDRSICTWCKACYQNCPVQAISMVNSKAVIDPKFCVKCHCCQESCEFGAILTKFYFLRSQFLYKIVKKLWQTIT